MESIPLAGKIRTEGDDIVKLLIEELVLGFGGLLGDVDTDLIHHPNGQWMDIRRENSSTLYFLLRSSYRLHQAFSDLAADRIPRAEEKNLLFYLCHCFLFLEGDWAGYEASITLFIPPRTLNSPVTIALIGLEALTKSLRIRLTAFS